MRSGGLQTNVQDGLFSAAPFDAMLRFRVSPDRASTLNPWDGMALARNSSVGQSSVIHRPRWSVIGRLLVQQWAVFLFLLAPPLAAALLDGQLLLAVALGGPAAAAVLAGLLPRKDDPPDDVRRIESVLLLVMVFVVGILMTSPAYLALGLGWVDAVFEATSAITTTGFSMIATPEDLPLSAHILRAWSQWCGGLVIAVAGLAFLMDRGPVAKALGFADFGEEPLTSSVRAHARSLLVAYVAITSAGIVGAAILVPGYIEGPLLALTAVSTGGMAPRADSLASYPFSAQAFIVGLSACGALSLAFPVLAFRRGLRSAARSSALVLFLIGLSASMALTAVLFLVTGERSPEVISKGVLDVLSVQSTTGFTTGGLPGPLPVFVLMMVLMAVGGQTGSTAGGMKIDRIRVLLGSVVFNLRRLLSPSSAVLYVKVDDEIVDQDRALFAIALVVTYLATALFLWIAFSIYGLPAVESLFDIISALSTVGAGTGVIGPDLPWVLKLLTVCAMLLGRVEFFGLLVLALPQTWKRRG